MCLLMYTTGGRPRKADVAKAKRAINERMATTIIIVEQNILTTLEMVDRALVLRSGEVVFDGNSSDLARKEDLWSRF